jgi:hypothetical protein
MAAYHEAVVRAIATIREYRAVELAGTTFTAIPHDSLMDEPGMDHDILMKKKPKLAARLLDRYRKMVGSLHNTHQVLVEDKAEMLDDLIDTTRRQERAHMTRQEYLILLKYFNTTLSNIGVFYHRHGNSSTQLEFESNLKL